MSTFACCDDVRCGRLSDTEEEKREGAALPNVVRLARRLEDGFASLYAFAAFESWVVVPMAYPVSHWWGVVWARDVPALCYVTTVPQDTFAGMSSGEALVALFGGRVQLLPLTCARTRQEKHCRTRLFDHAAAAPTTRSEKTRVASLARHGCSGLQPCLVRARDVTPFLLDSGRWRLGRPVRFGRVDSTATLGGPHCSAIVTLKKDAKWVESIDVPVRESPSLFSVPLWGTDRRVWSCSSDQLFVTAELLAQFRQTAGERWEKAIAAPTPAFMSRLHMSEKRHRQEQLLAHLLRSHRKRTHLMMAADMAETDQERMLRQAEQRAFEKEDDELLEKVIEGVDKETEGRLRAGIKLLGLELPA